MMGAPRSAPHYQTHQFPSGQFTRRRVRGPPAYAVWCGRDPRGSRRNRLSSHGRIELMSASSRTLPSVGSSDAGVKSGIGERFEERIWGHWDAGGIKLPVVRPDFMSAGAPNDSKLVHTDPASACRAANARARIRIRIPRMPSEIVFVVEEAPEGGYTARAVGESIFTEADDVDHLRAQVRDAVRCHFHDGDSPRLIRLHFVRDEVIAP